MGELIVFFTAGQAEAAAEETKEADSDEEEEEVKLVPGARRTKGERGSSQAGTRLKLADLQKL